MEMGDRTPFVGTMDELDQIPDAEELPIKYTVPVAVDGPVQVHQVPSVSAGARSWNLTATEAQKVGSRDPRRRVARIVSIDQNFYYGSSQNEASGSTGAQWPKLVPLEITHSEEIWVRSATSTTVISVVNEQWAS